MEGMPCRTQQSLSASDPQSFSFCDIGLLTVRDEAGGEDMMASSPTKDI